MRLHHLALFGLPAAVLATIATVGDSQGTPPVDEAARLRCATRLSISLTGKAPDAPMRRSRAARIRSRKSTRCSLTPRSSSSSLAS
jgi:hypothetical protein